MSSQVTEKNGLKILQISIMAQPGGDVVSSATNLAKKIKGSFEDLAIF